MINQHQTFVPYTNENNVPLAAFLFEDGGVTAYKGAAPLISSKTYLEAAAGILAVETYYAAIIRTSLSNEAAPPKCRNRPTRVTAWTALPTTTRAS